MNQSIFSKVPGYLALFLIVGTLASCQQKQKEESVKSVMDKTISHLYQTMDAKQLLDLKYD